MAIKIFVDQGHNPQGFNSGAEGFGLREQDITYNVGVMLADYLKADPRFEVMLSRNSPDEVLGTNNSTSLATRVNMANNWHADYFLSIHANANTNPNIQGSEMYVYAQNTQSYWLAEHLLKTMVKTVVTKDNGVRLNPSLYVLRNTRMPAVLVELAYLSNASDAEKLKNDQPLFAEALYKGLLSYFALT